MRSPNETSPTSSRHDPGRLMRTARLLAADQEAEQAGDTSTADDAETAIPTAADWAILHEMAETGGYSQVVWEIVDNIVAGGPTSQLPRIDGVKPPDPDKPLDAYRHAFGRSA